MDSRERAPAVYTAILEPEPDGRYSVHVPALPGVHSFGNTRQEALRNVVEAIELWIEVEIEQGRTIPGNDPLAIIADVSRIIAEQRADGREPQLELVPVAIPISRREAA